MARPGGDLPDGDSVQSLDDLRGAYRGVGVPEAAVTHGVVAPGVDGAVLGEGQTVDITQGNVHNPGVGQLLADSGQEDRVVGLGGAQAKARPGAPCVDLVKIKSDGNSE